MQAQLELADPKAGAALAILEEDEFDTKKQVLRRRHLQQGLDLDRPLDEYERQRDILRARANLEYAIDG